MNYCKPINETTAEHYNLRQLKKDNPQVSFPAAWFAADANPAGLADYGVYPYSAPEQPSFDPLAEKVQKGDILLASGEWTLQWIAVPLDADELVEVAEQQKATAKMTGVEFEGVMCSATAEDMWGLSSVQGYVAGGMDTPFKFDNGNVLVLTPANMAAFQAVWVPFRASFF